MFKTAKCSHCGESISKISNVHFELYNPGLKGGSGSFVAIASPCGHAIGAVPVTWENDLKFIQQQIKNQQIQIQNISYEISNIRNILERILRENNRGLG